MAESSSSSVPALAGLSVETVEWLPSGAESGLVRVRGRWIDEAARQPELPVLALLREGEQHRFDSLPDARFSRDPSSWRGTYLVPAELVVSDPDALWLEWADGARSGLPALARGVEPPPVPGAPERPEPPEETGGQVIDRAVLAERRARRAEAAEQHQARVAAEALKAVEVLELRSAELERRLEEATAERDELAARDSEAADRREALAAALASAAALRARSREWRLHLRTSEVARAGDAVRLAVLEADRAAQGPALRDALLARTNELRGSRREIEAQASSLAQAHEAATSARAALGEAESRLAASEARRTEVEAELRSVRAELGAAREEAAGALRELEAALATAEARLGVETVARTTLEDELDRERANRRAAADELTDERAAVADLRIQVESLRAELESARREAATATDLRSALEAARAEAATAADLRAALDTARADAAAAADLRAALDAAQTDLATVRADAASAADLRAALDAAQTDLATARADAASAADLRAALDAAETDLASARADAASAADLRAELEAARADAAAVADLPAEIQVARAEAAAARGVLADLRSELEAERAARREADQAGATLQERIAELERRAASGREELERLAREQAAAAAARPATEGSAQVVADLDAAAESLRRRVPEPAAPDAEPQAEAAEWPPADAPAEPAVEPAQPPPALAEAPPIATAPATAEPAAPDAEPAVEWTAPTGEPAAPDAEPAVEWSDPLESPEREPVQPAAEPPRTRVDAPDREWAPRDLIRVESVEPPAPDAEPFVELAPPPDPPLGVRLAERSTPTAAPPAPPAEPSTPTAAPPAPPAAPSEAPATDGAPPGPPPVVMAASQPLAPEPTISAPPPAGPRIVPASGPPPRALMLGTERRDYPLLRGAIVKLAHDDAATAGRVLAALLPAQGALIDGPLSYDLTIRGTGTYAIAIAGGRASAEPLERPRSRGEAEFHLTADPLVLAELLAGVEHRIGRFFGPARVRGRKRRVKALQPLTTDAASLTDAARAGAALGPELVYRTFAYAVHPSWTRGHTFTVAQAIVGDPPEIWYLQARDGAGLTVSTTAPQTPPAATVTMSRETFDRMLRGEPLPSGTRPTIRGDRHAVELMRAWTERAR